MLPLHMPPPPATPLPPSAAGHSTNRCIALLFSSLAVSSMGGSLRRHKRSKPRIIKRHKKQRFVKSEVPQDLVHNADELRQKLGAG